MMIEASAGEVGLGVDLRGVCDSCHAQEGRGHKEWD